MTSLRSRLEDIEHRRIDRVPTSAPLPRGESSVLLLLVEEPKPSLVLTRRAATLRAHPGDIALPGGALDPGESSTDAALRELHEEVGVDATGLTVHGQLDDSWSGAGYVIHVHVASIRTKPVFIPAPAEVDEALTVALDDLGDRNNLSYRSTTLNNHEFVDPVITIGDLVVYGVTADIVLDLTSWIAGHDRREVPKRLIDLKHFAPFRGWV